MKRKITLLSALFLSGSSMVLGQATGSRTVFVEEFTNASCSPCASQNPGFNAILLANPTTEVLSLKYQWYYPGYDPMNEQNPTQPDDRIGYYNESGVPTAVVDGVLVANDCNAYAGAPACMSQAELDARRTIAAPVEVDVTWDWSSSALDAIDITVTVNNTNSGTDFTGADRLHVAIIEEHIEFDSAPGSNGEQAFEFVMREMITTSNGEAMGTVTAASPLTRTFTAQALPSYLYSLEEVAVVAWVQNNSSREVFNAGYGAPVAFPSGVNTVDLAPTTNSVMPNGYCDYNVTPIVNISNNGDNDIASFDVSYAIDGGTPVVQSVSTPLVSGGSTTVNFPMTAIAPGTSVVSYEISNLASGSVDINGGNNVMPDDVINTLSATSQGVTLTEGFEMGNGYFGTIPSGIIDYISPDFDGGVIHTGQTGQGTNIGGYAASTSSLFYDYYASTSGKKMAAIIDKTDLSGYTYPTLSFDYAYAQYTSENDRLQVFVSSDCGATWTSVWNKAGTALSTSPAQSARFWPTANTWETASVVLSSVANTDEVILKFEGTSNYGNALFVDNVNLGATPTDVEEVETALEINIVPNPVKEKMNIQFTLEQNDEVSLQISNAFGQMVKTVVSGAKSGNNSISIDITDLASGVYLVNLTSQNGVVSTKRFIVE